MDHPKISRRITLVGTTVALALVTGGGFALHHFLKLKDRAEQKRDPVYGGDGTHQTSEFEISSLHSPLPTPIVTPERYISEYEYPPASYRDETETLPDIYSLPEISSTQSLPGNPYEIQDNLRRASQSARRATSQDLPNTDVDMEATNQLITGAQNSGSVSSEPVSYSEDRAHFGDLRDVSEYSANSES